ncbi:glucosylglycerol 3-phosphatase [Prochlorococcus sp. MIT 1307]|uniref:glucosylglycerol 3-phosphatase n=1 Tax=Prochlorococcus sp. MIT 1307 TaxID=3096219 RepID=UPI002A74D6FF|nr:glucosylglycerol 3-phosphatase [Prochlorococcus sp. MIT 1307]
MQPEIKPSILLEEILASHNYLIVQDIDGVCIPLVKDPLERKVDITYVQAARKFNGEFAVLTNGEHEGTRGVNRVIEKAYKSANLSHNSDIYLPGLAAGGIEYQNKFGQVEYPGVSNEELQFLSRITELMEDLLTKNLTKILPMLEKGEAQNFARAAVLATRFSPTVNLNGIFSLIPNDIKLQQKIQIMLMNIMDNLLSLANSQGLNSSFFLHIAPNLGERDNKEAIKFSSAGDVGTTDIQFMLSGAVKEAGLLVLINKFIQNRFGKAPLGQDFNVRNAPRTIQELKDLCQKKISGDEMPLIIGVGDTVTSHPSQTGEGWQRGGSDRGFLTLIQELGTLYNKRNRVVLVDSSFGEVDRPSLSNNQLKGISDPDDPLKFNTYFRTGPKGYIKWFSQLAEEQRVVRQNML